MGGNYELTCQKMLWTGIRWMEKNHITVDDWKGTEQYERVYGILKTPNKIQPLEDIWHKKMNLDMTGAMHQAVCNHLMNYLTFESHEKYLEAFKDDKDPNRIFEIDVDSLIHDAHGESIL